MHPQFFKTKSPVAARQLVTFFCLPKRNLRKKRAPRCPAPFGGTLRYSPSRAQHAWRPAEYLVSSACCCPPSPPQASLAVGRRMSQLGLARNARGLRQCSPTSPDSAALLGGSEGEP